MTCLYLGSFFLFQHADGVLPLLGVGSNLLGGECQFWLHVWANGINKCGWGLGGDRVC